MSAINRLPVLLPNSIFHGLRTSENNSACALHGIYAVLYALQAEAPNHSLTALLGRAKIVPLFNFAHHCASWFVESKAKSEWTLLEKIKVGCFEMNNLTTGLSLLRDFNLIDTAALASQLGQFKVFSFVTGVSLSNWSLGFAAVGLLVELLDKAAQYHDKKEMNIKCLAVDFIESLFHFIPNGLRLLAVLGVLKDVDSRTLNRMYSVAHISSAVRNYFK